MLSRPQQILLKRAQKQAGLSDDEYRDALETIAGCRTSKSSDFTDRHLDKVLAYFEAIYWRGVDAGALQRPGNTTAVYRQRGFWAAKNTNSETSRDRFNGTNLTSDITALEAELARLGFNQAYCHSIRKKVTAGRNDAHALHLYRTALDRTVKAKARREEREPDLY